MSPVFLLLILLLGGLSVFLLVMSLDRSRIRNYIESRGGRVAFINWAPFGKGWFGERDSRIYKVRYTNRDGDVVEGFCKTGFFSGVYFSDENVIHRTRPKYDYFGPEADQNGSSAGGIPDGGAQSLQEENRRLREENRRLRDELEILKKWCGENR